MRRPLPIILVLSVTLILVRAAVSMSDIHQPMVRTVYTGEEDPNLTGALEALKTPGKQADMAMQALILAQDPRATVSSGTATALLHATATYFSAHPPQQRTHLRETLEAVLDAHASSLPTPLLRSMLDKPDSHTPPRHVVLRLLVESEQLSASKALAQLLVEGLDDEERTAVLEHLVAHPHHPAILLPPVFTLQARSPAPALSALMDALLLAHAEAQLLPRRLIETQRVEVMARYDTVLAAAQRDGTAHLQILLHLLGYLPVAWSTEAVQAALSHSDTEVVLWAAVAQLRHGTVPPQSVTLHLAEALITRTAWLQQLYALHRLELCPAQFKTDQARAEAELASWLAYPTELGRVPAAMEFVQTVRAKDPLSHQENAYWVFRFKDKIHADGWLAGVAGPVRPLGEPEGLRYTGSNFDAMESMTPQEHVRSVLAKVAQAAGDNPT